MENNHLTYFKIENFKKFATLEVSDIGQFNLVVGDNNVGKTCFLEALLFDEDGQQLLDNFYIALTKRGLHFEIEKRISEKNGIKTEAIIQPKENYFENNIIKKDTKELKITAKFKNESETKIGISEFTKNVLAIQNIDNKKPLTFINKYNDEIILKNNLEQFVKIYISINDEKQLNNKPYYWIYDYNLDIQNFPLISFNDSSLGNKCIELYNNLDINGEEVLLKTLQIINPDLFKIGFKKEFEDLNDVFVLSFNGETKLVPINFLGDGFKRIFYIILKTISLRGKRIMIDEIEIGIHHSKLKDFWVNIIKVCKELEVQLFASTHSDECVKDYLDAANELGEQDLRLIRLQENKDKTVKAICYKKEYIEYIVESNTEER